MTDIPKQRVSNSNRKAWRECFTAVVLGMSVFAGSIVSAQAEATAAQLRISKTSTVSTGGSFDLVARCNAGEVRLGGGYKYQELDLSAHDTISIEGNFPSGSNAWIVRGTHNNPDSTPRYIVSEAYCLKSPNVFVRTFASTTTTSELRNSGFFGATSQVTCPSTMTLTGGGFKTNTTVDHSGLYNAWMSSFKPIENTNGEARGWKASLDAISWGASPGKPKLQTFAVCATSNGGPEPIKSSIVVQANIAPRTEFGYTPMGPTVIQCPVGQVALGGGYQFGNSESGQVDLLVPHQIFQSYTVRLPEIIGKEVPDTDGPATGGIKTKPASANLPVYRALDQKAAPPRGVRRAARKPAGTTTAPSGPVASGVQSPLQERPEFEGPGQLAPQDINLLRNFGGWHVGGVFGSQRPLSHALTGYAVCVKLPSVQFTVEITSPENGAAIGNDTSPRILGYQTLPIQFTAVARDENGNTLNNVSFGWKIDGVYVGGTSSITKVIPTASCGVTSHIISVGARDSEGRLADDEVTIMAGQIC